MPEPVNIPQSLKRRLPRFCAYCGREMVEVFEPGLFDTWTGERLMVAWLQCPRWTKGGFRSLFRGVHESVGRDHPIPREYHH